MSKAWSVVVILVWVAAAALEAQARRIVELECEAASAIKRFTAVGIERTTLEENLARAMAETKVLRSELESANGAVAATQVPYPWRFLALSIY
jgi:hypothetical protein